MNPVEQYLNQELRGLGRWSPQRAMPNLPEMPGFELGHDVAIPLRTYMTEALVNVWKVVPRDQIEALVNEVMAKIASAVSDVSDLVQAAVQIVSGIASAASMVVPIIQAVVSAPKLVQSMILETQNENDQNRRDARLIAAEYVSPLHPKNWVAPGNMAFGYPRKRKYKKDIDDAMIYPPAGSIPFGNTPIGQAPGEGCRVSSADWCGLDRCTWTWGWFPLFFPYFHPDIFGRMWAPTEKAGTPPYLRGMQGSNDGGAAVLATLMGYQTALLSNPVLNLQADGRQVQEIWRFFYNFFWTSYHTWSPTIPIEGAQIGMHNDDIGWTRIDKEFNPDNRGEQTGDYLYLAPNGMIGAYSTSGEGSIEDVVLNDWHVWMRNPNDTGLSDTGGNFITARDYNTILSVVQTFFATRRATVADELLCKGLVDNSPGMFDKKAYPDPYSDEGGIVADYPIPEASVRQAIQARAAGESAGVQEVQIARFPVRRQALTKLGDEGEAVIDAARIALTTRPSVTARLINLDATKPQRKALGPQRKALA